MLIMLWNVVKKYWHAMPAAISTGKGSELSLSQTHLAGGRRDCELCSVSEEFRWEECGKHW
jgi:hypothetical protein